jgi:hypothetical protein
MPKLLPLLFLLACAPLHAQVYKWVDSQGNVQYSDQPPASAKGTKKLNVNPQPSAAPVSKEASPKAAKTTAEKEMEFRKRHVESEEAKAKEAKAEADAKIRQQNCAQARGQLRALQEGRRIVKYNDAGERVFLDDQARPEETARAQKAVDDWCK